MRLAIFLFCMFFPFLANAQDMCATVVFKRRRWFETRLQRRHFLPCRSTLWPCRNQAAERPPGASYSIPSIWQHDRQCRRFLGVL